jgi:prevent-host-death family protein
MAAVPSKILRDHLSEFIQRSAYGKERHVVTRNRREVAAIVPLEDLRLLEAMEDLIDLDEARRALAEAEKEGTVSWQDLKKDLGL